MTRPEAHANLHPQQRGRRLRYLLHHWRHCAAWRALWRMLADRTRSPLPRRPAPDLSAHAVMRWLRPGDILLDAAGDELAWLAALLAARPGAAAIAYRSDNRRTAHFGYLPVETVWLLEQSGYQVRLLTQAGPVARPVGWHTPGPDNQSGCWLLAAPATMADPYARRYSKLAHPVKPGWRQRLLRTLGLARQRPTCGQPRG